VTVAANPAGATRAPAALPSSPKPAAGDPADGEVFAAKVDDAVRRSASGPDNRAPAAGRRAGGATPTAPTRPARPGPTRTAARPATADADPAAATDAPELTDQSVVDTADHTDDDGDVAGDRSAPIMVPADPAPAAPILIAAAAMAVTAPPAGTDLTDPATAAITPAAAAPTGAAAPAAGPQPETAPLSPASETTATPATPAPVVAAGTPAGTPAASGGDTIDPADTADTAAPPAATAPATQAALSARADTNAGPTAPDGALTDQSVGEATTAAVAGKSGDETAAGDPGTTDPDPGADQGAGDRAAATRAGRAPVTPTPSAAGDAAPAGTATTTAPPAAARPFGPVTTTGITQTVASPGSAPAPTPGSEAWRQVTAGAEIRRATEGQTVTVRTAAPDLGTVEVQAQLSQGQLDVRLHAGTDGARATLDRALPSLRAELEAAGVATGALEARQRAMTTVDAGTAAREAGRDPGREPGGRSFDPAGADVSGRHGQRQPSAQPGTAGTPGRPGDRGAGAGRNDPAATIESRRPATDEDRIDHPGRSAAPARLDIHA
jgi:flagellar hook-length control protein FliK